MGRLPEAWIAPARCASCGSWCATGTRWCNCAPAEVAGPRGAGQVRHPGDLTDMFGAGQDVAGRPGAAAAVCRQVASLRSLPTRWPARSRCWRQLPPCCSPPPGYPAIQALPGIGPMLAAVIVAEIGDITRFPRPGQLCSWAGLTPRHRESDTTVSRGQITKMACASGTVPPRRLEVCDGDGRRVGSAPGQLTFDYIDPGRESPGVAGSHPRTGKACAGGCAGSPGRRMCTSRSRGAPGGGMSSRSCSGPEITPHVAEPAETASRGAASGGPRPTGLMPATFASYWPTGGYRSRGFPWRMCWRPAPLVRLYKDLLEERTSWQQRVHATLFHQGIPVVPKLGTAEGAGAWPPPG